VELFKHISLLFTKYISSYTLVTKLMSKMSKKLTLGTPAPKSGQYQIIGPRGGKGPERTSTKGNPLPPTPKSDSTYILVDKTKTK